MSLRSVPANAVARDPATPLWWGALVLRVITLLFAVGAVMVHDGEYQRPWLAWTVLGAMTAWTALTGVAYAYEQWRRGWLVILDVLVVSGLMLTSPLILTDAMYAVNAPLITTVWVSAAPVVAAGRFGPAGGVGGGLAVAVATGFAQQRLDLDVVRDGVLLVASGLIIGLAVQALRRAAVVLTTALRTEATTAERERLARSIHDGVLQVLAQVRKRGTEFGGEAAELAGLAGEQEIALRALVSSGPLGASDADTADLRARLQLRTTARVQVSTPAGEVRMPADTVNELVAVVIEALANVSLHAGDHAHAWVFLEDLGHEVVLSVRDDGYGIPAGRLERAAAEGRLGVTQSIEGRVAALGGTITLDTAPGSGTEWEFRVPRGGPTRHELQRSRRRALR
ncbi:MAG: MacS family sensor histidine kinase [Pseudonocardiaceae bacterium]